MRKTEIILGLLGLAGIILKSLLSPLSITVTTISFFTLAMIYLLFGFALFNNIRLRSAFMKESYQGLSSRRIWGTIIFGFSIATVLLGSLFKLNSWEGQITLLMFGLIFLFICLVVALIRYQENKSGYYKLIFIRTAIIGSIGLLLYLTPQTTITSIFYRNHPAYVQAVKNLEADHNNKALQKEVDRQRHLMRGSSKNKRN